MDDMSVLLFYYSCLFCIHVPLNLKSQTGTDCSQNCINLVLQYNVAMRLKGTTKNMFEDG